MGTRAEEVDSGAIHAKHLAQSWAHRRAFIHATLPSTHPLLQGNEMERMLKSAGSSGVDTAHLRTK